MTSTHDNGAYVKLDAGTTERNAWIVEEVRRGGFTVAEIASMMESLVGDLSWKVESAERVE